VAEHHFKLVTVVRELDDGSYLGEALNFPEVSRFASKRSAVHAALVASARKIVERIDALEIHRRHIGDTDPEVRAIDITFEPPSGSSALREPLPLTFHYVQWRHGPHYHLAYVPALQLQAMSHDAAGLDAALRAEIRTALIRMHAHTNVQVLTRCQSTIELRTSVLSVEADVTSPRERHRELLEGQKPDSVLEQVAMELPEEAVEVYEREVLVRRLAKPLAAKTSQSVLLVGPSGVGKTAIVRALAAERAGHQLGEYSFWTTSGSRLVAGMVGFGMWQQRCRELCEEAERTKAIVHFGGLIELMEVGRSENQSQGIASFLRPYMERSRVLAIAECTPEQLTVATREDPHLVQVFLRMDVEAGPAENDRAILTAVASDHEARRAAPITIEAVDGVERLHRRYASYSAHPGATLAFLDRLVRRHDHEPLDEASVIAAFTEETGLPRFMLDDATPLDLDETQAWFTSRVIGQPEAVKRVVDVIATAKAGLARPQRPIASLLFIGPTGVGKTEMAKALAERLFGDAGRLTRFDMSEYADPIAVERLNGGRFGQEGLLTSKVRDRPFSVVLFDELEKADPSFFDLLLQILGEARLTDGGGRVADFSNAVVIMTSNLGAEAVLKESLGFGTNDRASALRERFTHEVRAFFRPELVNRIDRVIAFSPLERSALIQIAKQQVDAVSKRDGIRGRGAELELEDDVPAFLAERGHDPRFGARPLRRAIERLLLAPLAAQLNEYTREVPVGARVAVDGDQLAIDARGVADDRKVTDRRADDLESARAATHLRRELDVAHRSPALRKLRNDVFRLQRLQASLATRSKRKRARPLDTSGLDRLPMLRKLAEDLGGVRTRACDLEEQILLAVYGAERIELDPQLAAVFDARAQWKSLILELMGVGLNSAHATAILMHGQSFALVALATAYVALLDGEPARLVEITRVRVEGEWKAERREVTSTAVIDFENPDFVAIAIELEAKNAYLRFSGEQGTHRFYARGKQHACFVSVPDWSPSALTVPGSLLARRQDVQPRLRRTYDLDRRTVEAPGESDSRFTGRELETSIAKSMNAALDASVRGFVAP